MKRFFCTICRKMKRVRKMPVIIQHEDAIDPGMRVGECNYHLNPAVRTHAPKVRPTYTRSNAPQPRKVKQARHAR